MRLLSLLLENWSCHERIEVDLSGGLQIEGRNGTGKSSILEAIRFIFKKTASGYTGRIRNGERRSSVSLTFGKDGKTYSVEKVLYVDKPSTALLVCDGVQVADNPTSVYNALQSILPEDVLDKLVYVPQNQITLVLDRLSGREGKVELDRLFGLDKLEAVWTAAGVEVGEAEARKGILEGRLKAYPEDALEQFDKRLSELSRTIGELKAGVAESGRQEAEAEGKLKAAEEKLAAMDASRKAVESAKAELSRLQMQGEGLKKELEMMRQRIIELQGRKAELAKVASDKSALEKYRPIRKLLLEKKALDDRLSGVGDMRQERERLSVLEKGLAQKPEAELRFIDAEAQLKESEKAFVKKEGELKRIMDYFMELNLLSKSAKCPKCGQFLTEFHLVSERREIKEKINPLQAAVKQCEEQANASAKALDELKKLLVRLNNEDAERRLLLEAVKKSDENAASLRKQAEALEKSLAEAGYAGDGIAVVESKADELSRLEARVQDIQREVGRLDEMTQAEKKKTDELSSIAEKSGELQKKIESTAYDEKAFGELKSERDKLFTLKNSLSTKAIIAAKDLEAREKELADADSKRREYSELKKSFDETSRNLALLKAAREVFHRDKGLAKYLREKVVSQLNARITAYFKRFNQKQHYTEVVFDKEYDIQFKTTSGVLSLDQISGGEKIQLALALRIALLDMMSPIRLLMLDEPFGSLDEDHREVLGETLSKIAETGQLVLVTHVHVDSLRLPRSLDLGGY